MTTIALIIIILLFYIVGVVLALAAITNANLEECDEPPIPRDLALLSWIFFAVILFGAFTCFLGEYFGRYIDDFYYYLQDKFRENS